jgi:hypothetical protein
LFAQRVFEVTEIGIFDDYDYKNTETRISVRFSQKRDEPMYPWEIASFLKALNTVYYKNELLNSICSCIANGIDTEDIFIFNKSLPLHKRYTAMDVLSDDQAAKHWYDIGLPYPLTPNERIYKHNLLYQAFHQVNSLLRKNRSRPLTSDVLVQLFQSMKQDGIDEAERELMEFALERSRQGAENAAKRDVQRTPLTFEEVEKSLQSYRKKKKELFEDLHAIGDLTATEQSALTSSKVLDDRRRAGILLAFFRHFKATARPLVCVRLANGKYRVLGRSLVNKNERTGLELKEIKRNSPLGALFEGGVAIYQAIQQEKRSQELHELEVTKSKLEIDQARVKLDSEKFKNLEARLNTAQKFQEIAKNSDIGAINSVDTPFLKFRLQNAYGIENQNAETLLHRRGLELDIDSIRFVSVRV